MLNKVKDKIININKKIKKWLESNKIYFETGVATALTIMSLMVANTANSIANKSNEISELEIEIQQKDKMPKFVTTIDENDNISIINTGGFITDGFISYDCYIKVYSFKNSSKTNSAAIEVYNPLSGMDVGYNYDDNCFNIESDILSFKEMYYDIKMEIDPQGTSINYNTYEIFKITYVDYFDNYCEEYYYLDRDDDSASLKRISSDTYDELRTENAFYIWCDKDVWSETTINESRNNLKNIMLDVINE